MRIATVSASSYKTYDWCEWKWFLSYCLGFYDESGPSAMLGSIAHKYLEIMSSAAIKSKEGNKNYWPDEQELWDLCFNYYYKKSPLVVGSIENSKIKKVIKGINDLESTEYSVYSNNTISSEIEFNIPLEMKECLIRRGPSGPEYVIATGKIDRVEKIDDESIEIIDYKTGSRENWNDPKRKKIDSDTLAHEIQSKIYFWAANEMYPWAKNILITFIYITDGGPVTTIFDKNDIVYIKNDLKERVKEITNNFEPQRSISWKCKNMCWFGKTGLCQDLWNEKNETSYNFIENKYSVLNDCKRNVIK